MVSRRERKIIIIRTAEKDLIRLGQEGSDFEGLSYTAKTPQNTKTNTHNTTELRSALPTAGCTAVC